MINIYGAKGKAEELVKASETQAEFFKNVKSAIQHDKTELEILPGLKFGFDFKTSDSYVLYDKEVANLNGFNAVSAGLMWDWEFSSMPTVELDLEEDVDLDDFNHSGSDNILKQFYGE